MTRLIVALLAGVFLVLRIIRIEQEWLDGAIKWTETWPDLKGSPR